MFKKDQLITLIFALIISLPLFDMYFNFSPVQELFEKRIAATEPKFEISKDYAKNFEKYFNDNYGFRKTLISYNSKIADKIFNESPDARAVVGKNGWFFFDNGNALLDAIGKAKLSDELATKGAQNFYQNWQMLKSKNIDYLLVIAADKSTVYPEFLPSYMKAKGPHRMDKFIKALKKIDKNFPILDLRPFMLEAKKREVVYHKTDTHWNKRGAHTAYLEIAKHFKLKPYLRDRFTATSDGRMRGDISDIMGVDTTNIDYDLRPKFSSQYSMISNPSYLRSFHKPYLTLNKNLKLPTLFTYKDSYFSDLTPFVSNHFSKAYYINEYPCDINYETIKNFHPDVLIHEFWEGRIEIILKSCSS
jgi:alginate O-acetyltransferase complex protein AlgJ